MLLCNSKHSDKMEKEKYIQDLADIKNMMEKSSRFISLSGLSGVLAGIFALIGAYMAWGVLYQFDTYFSRQFVTYLPKIVLYKLILIGAAVLFLSLTAGMIFTQKMAKKQGRKIWDDTAKRLLIHLAIPLITGGLFLGILLFKGLVGIVAPGTLIFYGLALINASKYTFRDIQYLGISEIIIGIIATYFIGYGLFFWAFGFGVLHIIYGIVMYLKYEKAT
jgi:hypothetical protein